MKNVLPVAVALLLATGSAAAHNCPNEMKAIDARLATQKAKKLRADGEAAHKAGRHDDSMKALGEAKKILGI